MSLKRTPRARRPQGTGAITKVVRTINGRVYPMYEIRYELPRAPDGRRRRKSKYRSTYADALVVLNEMRDQFARDGDMPLSSPTVKEWAKTWLEHKRPTIKARSWAGYEQRLRLWIIPAIGHLPLDRVTPAEVVKPETAAIQSGRQGSVRQIRATMNALFTGAVHAGMIVRSPLSAKAALPRLPAAGRGHAPSTADAASVLAHAMEDRLRARWLLSLLAGMRTGEILGITRDAVDTRAGVLRIGWQLQRAPTYHGCDLDADGEPGCGQSFARDCPAKTVNLPAAYEAKHVEGALYLLRPKSASGIRTIPLVGPLGELLGQHLAEQPGHAPSHLVWADEAGGLWTAEKDARAWKTLLRQAGVPEFKRHDARHLAATLMMRSGVPSNVAMQVLGHSAASMTAHYQHVDDADVRKALAAIGSALQGN